MIGTILDIVIAFLLLATVIYCIKLSRKITLIHQGKEELNEFIRDFNDAIVRAEDNIAELKDIGSDTEEKLQEHVQKARYLANDLSFLMDKGEKISSNLEHNLNMSKVVAKSFNANQSRFKKENGQRQSGQTARSGQSASGNIVSQARDIEERNNREKKRQEIERLLNLNESKRASQINNQPNANTSFDANVDNNNISLQQQIDKVPRLDQSVQVKPQDQNIESMTIGKRKALDEVLEQIASRKNVVKNDADITNSQMQDGIGNADIRDVKPSPGGKGGVVFDKRRLSEVLKTVQESK